MLLSGDQSQVVNSDTTLASYRKESRTVYATLLAIIKNIRTQLVHYCTKRTNKCLG